MTQYSQDPQDRSGRRDAVRGWRRARSISGLVLHVALVVAIMVGVLLLATTVMP